MSIELFFEEFWGRVPWASGDRDELRFADLFSMQAMDTVLAMTEPDRTRPRSEIEAFHLGFTATVGRIAEKWPPLAQFEHQLENFLGTKLHMGGILTPIHVTEQGITKPHYDVSDLFFVQISGRKRWRIYAGPIQDPIDPEGMIDVTKLSNPTPLVDVNLEPGQVLYIPAGFVHQNDSLGEHSLHVTIAAQMPRWSQIMSLYVKHYVERHMGELFMRSRIRPRCFSHSQSEAREVAEHVRSLFERIQTDVTPESVYGALFKSLIGGQAESRGHVDKIKYLSTFGASNLEDLDYFVRGDQLVKTVFRPEGIELSTLCGTVELPAEAGKAVHFIFEAKKFQSRAIPELDEVQLRHILGELILEGILGCERR